MVHGINTLAKVNDLAVINAKSGVTFHQLPRLIGILHAVKSSCGSKLLFKYPACAGRMARYGQQERGEFVFVVVDAVRFEAIGVGKYLGNFDGWAMITAR